MATPSYADSLAALAGGTLPQDDDQQQPSDYGSALDSLAAQSTPDPEDWWGQYWGHLKDHASEAYHASTRDEAPSMPSTDPTTLTSLIAKRAPYLTDIDSGSDPNADVETKAKAATSAKRLARIDAVLSQMAGQGPDDPMTDTKASDIIAGMNHEKLMASDRYKQVYDSTPPEMMPEDQRRAYARDVISKEAADLPYQRDSILAQLSGQDASRALEMYGVNALPAKQSDFYLHHDTDVPLPSSLQGDNPETQPDQSFLDKIGGLSSDAADLGEMGATHLAAGAMGIPATVNLLVAAPPAMLFDSIAKEFGGDEHAAQDWVFNNLVQPDVEEAKELRAGSVPQGFAQKLVAKLGDMAPAFALAMATRNPELATLTAPADLTALQTAAAAVEANLPGATAMAVPTTTEGALARAQEGDAPSGAEFAGELGSNIIFNTPALAAPGSLMARLAQGGASQGALGASQRAAAGAPSDAADVASDVALGMGMGAAHVSPHADVQRPEDVTAARAGFGSAEEAKAATAQQAGWEARFSKVLDDIGDAPEARARADYALTEFNDGKRSGLSTIAELRHIAKTGQTRDEEAYAAHQAATSPEAAEMGVTPESSAAEQQSEQAAGAEVFGTEPPHESDLPGFVGDHDAEPRFRLGEEEVHPAALIENHISGDAEMPPELDQPVSGVSADFPALGRAVHEATQAPGARQLPDAPEGETTLAGIAKAIAPDVDVEQLGETNEHGDQTYMIHMPTGDRYGAPTTPAALHVDGETGKMQFDISRAREGSGYGARLYHIINTFAHRNNFKASPDVGGLTAINNFRRTENMAASAGRTGSTHHLEPAQTQRLTGLWMAGRSKAAAEHNTGVLAHTAMENVYDRHPALSRMRFNFDNGRFEWSDGKPVTNADFRTIAGDTVIRSSGAGSSSLKRAVWTASVLREQRAGRGTGDVVEAGGERVEPGQHPGAAVRSDGDVGLENTRYRLGRESDGEQADRAATELNGERVPADETRGAAVGGEVAGEEPAGQRAAPLSVDAAAHVAETSPLTEGQPSTSKIAVGNYRKGHIRAQGLDISIENPRGSTRSGIGLDGRPFSRVMNHHYGYIRGTLGADGDHLDVLLGDQPHNPTRQVFVVDQHKPDGGFDEHKVMLGFRNQRAAEQAYLSEYPKGWQGMGRVRSMTAPEFKTWAKGAGRDEAATGPVSDNVPRVTLRHQQPDASTVHASTETDGTTVTAGTRGFDGEPLARLSLDNASLPSRRRVVLDEVQRGQAVPDGHASAVLRNVYDLGRDTRNLMQRARAEVEARGLPMDEDHVINEFERQVVANGFDGYRNEGHVTVLGHDVPVAHAEGGEREQPVPAEETLAQGEPEAVHDTATEDVGDAGRPGEGEPGDKGAESDVPAGEGAEKSESAPRQKVAYDGPGMSKSAAKGLVKLLKWHAAETHVEVHQSEADLPARLRNNISPEFRGRVHGIYDGATGKVHVIADKMTSPKELYRTLTEEHLGHGGLRKIFNKHELNDFLDRAWSAIPKSERASIARDYRANASLPEGRRLVAEEYLAKLDPAGRGKTLFEKFNDWFNATSRKMGRDVDYSPSELREVMYNAHDHQRAGLSPSHDSRSPVDLVTPRHRLDGGFHYDKNDEPAVDDVRYRVARAKGTKEQEESMARTMKTPPEDLTLGDRARRWLADVKASNFRDGWEGFKQGMLDAGNQVARIEREVFGGFLGDAAESPYKMYNLAKNGHAVMAAVMKLGVPEYKDGSFQPVAGRKGMFEVFRPLYQDAGGESLMPLWEFYAAARRADRLIKETNVNGTLREQNFSQEDINRGLALELKYPVFKKVADDFQEFNNHLLDLAADRGAISDAEAASWKANFYVPFYRAMEELEQTNAPKTKRGSVTANQKIYSRRLTGSEEKVDNVFENILANTAYVLDRTYKQEFMNRLLDMGEGTVLERVPMANKAVSVSVGDLARALEKGGFFSGSALHQQHASPNIQPSKHWATVEVDRLTPAEKAQWSTVFQRVAPTDPDVVPIMRNGKQEYYRVTDPLLLRTIGAMGHDSFGKVIGVLSSAKRGVTWGVTKDPGFMAATWFRDTLINWVGSHSPITPFVDNMKGAISSVRGDPIVSKLMMAGVGVAPHYETQGAKVRTQLERNYGKTTIIGLAGKGLDFYNRVGIAAEASSRIAIAKSVLARGGSMAEAAYQAQDILNYSMRGDYTAARILSATAPFWNAGMQGLYRFMRGAGVANAKAGDTSQLKSYMLRGSVLLAATIANAWKNQDDPRYNRLSNDDKDRYWHFFIGDQHFKLPKPFEAGVVFGSLPERIMQRLNGNDTTRDTLHAMQVMVTEEMRLNFLPQIIRQGVEQWANKDTSSWRAIVPASTADELPETQYSPFTHVTAKAIASGFSKVPWLNSPQRVEHLTRALAGTMGVYALDAGDWLARASGLAPSAPTKRLQDMPVVKRFYAGDSDSGDRSKYEDKLYEMRAEADATFQSFQSTVQQGDTEHARELMSRPAFQNRATLDAMSRDVSKIRSAEKQIMQNPFIGPEEKRQQLDNATDVRIKLLDQYGPFLDSLHDQF